MESAIPPILRPTRTRHRRVPDDYKPPYPSFVARHRPAVEQVVMAYFGVQHAGDAPPARAAALDWVAKRICGCGRAPRTGTARATSTKPAIPTSFPLPIGTIRTHSKAGFHRFAKAGPGGKLEWRRSGHIHRGA